MEPVAITAEDAFFLPEHEWIEWAKDQSQYRSLISVRLVGREGRVLTRWRLTPEELSRLVAGEDLYLEQLTFNNPLQPILPQVGLLDYCPRDRM